MTDTYCAYYTYTPINIHPPHTTHMHIDTHSIRTLAPLFTLIVASSVMNIFDSGDNGSDKLMIHIVMANLNARYAAVMGNLRDTPFWRDAVRRARWGLEHLDLLRDFWASELTSQ